MVAPAWLARLLDVDGEIEDEELAGRLAQRLRLQVPTGPEGVGVMTRFALLAETLHRRPDELVQEALPDEPSEVDAATAQLGLRKRSELERVLRLAAREVWAYLASQPAAAQAPSPEEQQAEDDRLAAFAAQAIAEVRGETPSAAPPSTAAPPSAAAPQPAGDTPEARLEALAAEAIAEARGEQAPPAAPTPQPAPPRPTTPAAPSSAPSAASPPAPAPLSPPAATAAKPAPRTFGEQLEAAGPLIVFLATVGAGTIVGLLVWLIGTAVGVFGNSGI